MTSSAGPATSAPSCAPTTSGTCWTCRATPRCATWARAGRRAVRDPTSGRFRGARPPPARESGRERLPEFERADAWAARQPKGRWRPFVLPGGEKGPLLVKALQQRVQAKEEGGLVGPSERLVVIK